MLWKSRSGRETLEYMQKTRPMIFWWNLLIFIIIYLIYYWFYLRAEIIKDGRLLIAFFLLILPYVHFAHQSFGIGLSLLGKNLSKEKRKSLKNQFQVFWISSLSVIVLRYHKIYFNEIVPASWLDNLSYFFYILALVSLGFYSYGMGALGWGKNFKLYNTIYVIRYLPIIFIFNVSPFVFGLCNSAIHGVEYVVYNYEILKKENRCDWTFFVFILISCLVFIFLSQIVLVKSVFPWEHTTIAVLFALNYAITYVHYNLDHYFYSKKYSSLAKGEYA